MRFGHALEIDREAMEFLDGILRDEEAACLHGSALSALARWGSPEAFDRIGGVLAKPVADANFAHAVEVLAECTSPEAVRVTLEFFRRSSDPQKKLIGAKVLLQMSQSAPDLALAGTLRQEVRPTLQNLYGAAPEGWTKQSMGRMIEHLP